MIHEDRNGALSQYLQEVSRIPLLTREDEVNLSKLIKKGDAKAREKMIQANLRLVVKIAHDYANFGLPLLDLISEGNIGLMKAVERFDSRKGNKFSTYASFWIKQGIKRALANQSKTIRLPVHLVDKLAKMRRAVIRLTEELDRPPTEEELAKDIGISPAKVAQMKQAALRPASLNSSIGDDEFSELANAVPDENAHSPLEELEDKDIQKAVKEVIHVLDEREKAILSLRFPLDEEAQQITLEEVGKKFKVTRERIRQIQNQALIKLKRALDIKDKIKSL